jgi:hypothetical protein
MTARLAVALLPLLLVLLLLATAAAGPSYFAEQPLQFSINSLMDQRAKIPTPYVFTLL